ncbi:hypothetical protein [Bradyrhizobium liaoningense]|nr:hypothetical protein [Bradyrhizobium liaoningense]MBR0948319.1 hypothetical protein [Bradyrhizobium liaoningense]
MGAGHLDRQYQRTDAKETMDISGNFLLVAEKEGAALRIKAHTWSVNSPM